MWPLAAAALAPPAPCTRVIWLRLRAAMALVSVERRIVVRGRPSSHSTAITAAMAAPERAWFMAMGVPV